ncbi:hypothetical protein [Rothia uropygioeca]|uniref:hypothetical protein n=1 Tax=Kocuria sp. 257 TaxID=2021970 RepID=UPI001011729E|nr:hypothetical protein [Kocuria sp. 257]
MVGNLLSLKWAYFVASLKRSGWALAGTVIGGIYGLFGLFMVFAIFMVQRGGEASTAQGSAVILGAVVTLLWCIVPVVATGQDSTLDPDLLAPYPLKPQEILGGQLLGSFISIFGMMTLVGAFFPAVSWTSPLPVAAAILAGVIGFVLLMICSRLMSALGMAIRQKRFLAEGIGAVFFLALLCAGPLVGTLTEGLFSPTWISTVASVVGWTPFGAAWAIPGDVAQRAWFVLVLRLVVTALYTTGALLLWQKVIAYQTSHVGNASGASGGRTKSGKWLGLFSRFPATQAGGIAAKTATYYLKDPRLNLNLLVAPGFLVVFWFTGMSNGGASLTIVAPLVGWMLAWQSTYSVSYDNTAFALHLTSPITGAQDRWGRSIGMSVIFVPVVVLVSVIAMLLQGNPGGIPANLGLGLCLLLAGLGVGACVSVRYALPVAAPGESPWKSRKNNAGLANALVQMVGSLLIVVMALPVWILLILSMVTGNAVFDWIILLVGPIYGSLVLWLGVRIGGGWYERRAPELYQDLTRFQ